jgi:hypothetical protein
MNRWLSKAFSLSHLGRPQTTQARRRQRPLALERLEDRTVPTLFISLQEAGVNGGLPTVVATGADFTAAQFTGTYGDFSVSVVGVSSHNAANLSFLDSSATSVKNIGASATLKIAVFQDNYTLPAGSPLVVESGLGGSVTTGNLSLSNIFQASASSTNNTTFDFTNGPQTATPTGSTFDTGSATGQFNRSGNYSLSSTAAITLTAGGEINFSSHVKATPSQTGTPVAPGQFATMGFWHNKNGQAVINSFNGSSDSTALGNWLSSNFGNLFGGLQNKTNAQIASAFLTAFGNVGGVQGNTYAQAFAVALGVYADTIGLGFNATAAAFGFNGTVAGGGNSTFNVGNDGAAFGVPNGTTLTVFQILGAVNANFNPATGLFYGGDQTLTSAANDVLDGINQLGDIP